MQIDASKERISSRPCSRARSHVCLPCVMRRVCVRENEAD